MTPQPFEAYLDITKTLVMIVGAAAMALGGLAFAWHTRANAHGNMWTSDTLVPLGLGVALFFVMATVSFKGYGTYQQGRSGPIVRIDDSGVLDRRVGPAAIPWAAITGAEIIDLSNARLNKRGEDDARLRPQVIGVVLHVEGAARYRQSDGAIEATAKTLAQATDFNEIAISPEGLHTTAEELLAAIEAWR